MRVIYIFYFLYSFLLLSQMISYGQMPQGLYTNSNEEFLCTIDDTIQFRIYNEDGFSTYKFGKGSYEIDKTGIISFMPVNVKSLTSDMKVTSASDSSLVLRALRINGQPIKFATFRITNKNSNKLILVGFGDENGEFTLNKKQIKEISFIEVILRIEIVGFETEKILKLQPGNIYNIQSIVPENFQLLSLKKNEKVCINKINDTTIEVKINNRIRRVLNKKENEYSCENLFFKSLDDF